MFPLYDNSGFTYRSLSEIRPGGVWTGLVTVAAAGRGMARLLAQALAGVGSPTRAADTRIRPVAHS